MGDEGAGGASGSGQSSAKGKTVKVYGNEFCLIYKLKSTKCNLGLVTAKLNQTRKLGSDTAALLKSTNTEPDFLKREEVFKKLRPELTQLFRYIKQLLTVLTLLYRNTQNSIGGVCKGFFEDPLHIAKHFEYLSESPSLDIMIRENLRKNLGRMYIFYASSSSIYFRQDGSLFERL